MMFCRCCQCRRQMPFCQQNAVAGAVNMCRGYRMEGMGDGATAMGATHTIPMQQGRQTRPCHCHEHRELCQEQRHPACSQLLESIAMEEKSIAELLAAEAQKLLFAAQNANMNQMTAVSQSVRQTLEAVIDLEHVLLEKLELTVGQCLR